MMAREERVSLSKRRPAPVDEPGSGWSFGKFLGGAVVGLVFSAVLFVASVFFLPPAEVENGADAAIAPEAVEEVAEVDEAPVEPVEAPAVEPEAVTEAEPEAPTEPVLEETPVEEERVAIVSDQTTETAAADPNQPSALDEKAWQVHRAAFSASSDMPLIAILLEAPNETAIPVDAILGLGIPFTMAVVPRDEQAAAFSQRARAAGLEVLAHVPMADEGAAAAGEVIGPDLSEQEVRILTQDFLARVPEAIGLSNFGGSAVTPNREVMAAVVAELNRKGHAFVAIRAGVDGAGMEVARDLGTPAVRNTLILQADMSEDEVYQLLDGAARDAATLGEVVVLAKTSAPVLLGVSRWALERNGKEARLAPLTSVLERRN